MSPNECEQNAVKVREIIMEFPEVNFLFDESIPNSVANNTIDFKTFLFFSVKDKEDDAKQAEECANRSIVSNLHTFDFSDLSVVVVAKGNSVKINPFIKACYYCDNLFDASNLRYAIKVRKYSDLKVAEHNYKNKQKQRQNNLALCVEEERSQSLFNSYALYASGYRMLPIITAHGLLWANNELNNKVALIVRDYDLQFPDETEDGDIHKIRGWKKNLSDGRWQIQYNEENKYWKGFRTSSTLINKTAELDGSPEIYYITKGDDGVKLNLPQCAF